MTRDDVQKAITVAQNNATVPIHGGRRASSFGEIAIAKALLHLADRLAPEQPVEVEVCGAPSPDAYLCTLPSGHEGHHRAVTLTRDVLADWPANDPSQDAAKTPTKEAS